MPKRQRTQPKFTGPKTSQTMSAHLAKEHHPDCFGRYIEAFKNKFPKREDAIDGFSPEMLAVAPELGGPYSRSNDLKEVFRSEFVHLSDVQKQFMKDIHINNYYSDNPKPMIFESGVTQVAGGEVLTGIRKLGDRECIVVKVLCCAR